RQSEFDHARKQLVRRPGEPTSGLRGIWYSVERESATLPNLGARWSGSAVQKRREGIAQHVGSGGWQQAHASLQTIIGTPLQQIGGVECIEFVDLHAPADLNVPAEPFLENPITQTMHFGQIVDELTIRIMSDKLHHHRLL